MHAKSCSKRIGTALGVFLISVQSALCQTKDASTMLSTAGTNLKNILNPLVTDISYILGLIGIVMVAPTLIKFLKGDPASSDAFVKLGAGFIIGFILLQIFKIVAF